MVRPNTTWINITASCNNRCIWCYAQGVNDKNTEVMPENEILYFLAKAKEIGCKKCVLIGGEPTIHPRFPAIFAKGKELDLKMRFVTNGRMFSSKRFCEEMLKAGLTTGDLTFSMHAPSREKSLALTGKVMAFDQFLHGLRNLISMSIRPFINITLCKPTLPYIENMMRVIKAEGIDSVSFNLGAPSVSRNSVNTDFTIAPDQLAKTSIDVFRLGKRLDMKTSFLFNIPFCLVRKEELEELLQNGAIVSGCQIISGRGLLLNVRGDIVPCNHLLDYVTLANTVVKKILNKESFPTFWNSNLMTSLRKSACVYRSEACKGCEWWDVCGGGCPIFWAHYNPQEYIKRERR